MAQPSPMSGGAVSAKTSELSEIDRALDLLRDRAVEFARLPAADKADLLRRCIPHIVDAAPAWVAHGCKAKGISGAHAGEEWIAGPMPTVRGARLMADALDEIAAHGRPRLGLGSSRDESGRLCIDLFPANRIDRALFAGFSGYALMQEGIDVATARRRQAEFYQARDPVGGVSLVLGAGNVSSIPPLDAFTKMFIEGHVVLLKMNPVNEWAGQYLERALSPLISRGYLQIVYGGADVGSYLVDHDKIDDVHITGSDKTHDLIVWGPPGPERDRRMADNEPRLQVPISSELGNVSPVAIVPYDYSDDELWFQARNVATMMTNNASFNCNAAKVLITSPGWPQRDRFFEMVGRALSAVPSRTAYYPGAFDRFRNLTRGRERVLRFGVADDEHLPWTILRDVDASSSTEPLFFTEPFCSILSDVPLGSGDPVEFLDTATAFMNDRLWGTLNACIIIHPRLEKDSAIGAALKRAIVELRYGTVAINHWPALCYGMGTMPWGGHPSATLKDVQSGLGWVHNTFMLDGVDKSVVRGPLKVWPVPIWFCDRTGAAAAGPKLVAMEASPRWRKVPGLVLKALR